MSKLASFRHWQVCCKSSSPSSSPSSYSLLQSQSPLSIGCLLIGSQANPQAASLLYTFEFHCFGLFVVVVIPSLSYLYSLSCQRALRADDCHASSERCSIEIAVSIVGRLNLSEPFVWRARIAALPIGYLPLPLPLEIYNPSSLLKLKKEELYFTFGRWLEWEIIQQQSSSRERERELGREPLRNVFASVQEEEVSYGGGGR